MVLRGPVIPRTDSERAFVTVHTLLFHWRPVGLPARTIRFTHTFGLGGSSLVLVTILGVTGILMMFVYQPVPAAAYDSVVTLEMRVLFGSFVRSIHYWSANLLLVVVLLHAARVFFTGGWHGSRQFNWVIGAGLLALVLANAFTGYLLPWDQLSYWAVTISTGMLSYVPMVGPGLERIVRGGADVGPETLTIFHTIHTLIVPASLLSGMAFHFWRVRKSGGVVVTPPGPGEEDTQDEKVLFVPNLLVREAALALVCPGRVEIDGEAQPTSRQEGRLARRQGRSSSFHRGENQGFPRSTTRHGPRSALVARPATDPARNTSHGRICRRWRGPLSRIWALS